MRKLQIAANKSAKKFRRRGAGEGKTDAPRVNDLEVMEREGVWGPSGIGDGGGAMDPWGAFLVI